MRFAPNDILILNYSLLRIQNRQYKTFYGYVDNTYRKGGGSASGQSSGNPEPEQTWAPKNVDVKRFLGEPVEIKRI